MDELTPEFRPGTSARQTVQPWGEHIVQPYSPDAEAAWARSVKREEPKEGQPDILGELNIEQLRSTIVGASVIRAEETLKGIRHIAETRIGEYRALIIEVDEEIAKLEGNNGERS